MSTTATDISGMHKWHSKQAEDFGSIQNWRRLPTRLERWFIQCNKLTKYQNYNRLQRNYPVYSNSASTSWKMHNKIGAASIQLARHSVAKDHIASLRPYFLQLSDVASHLFSQYGRDTWHLTTLYYGLMVL